MQLKDTRYMTEIFNFTKSCKQEYIKKENIKFLNASKATISPVKIILRYMHENN